MRAVGLLVLLLWIAWFLSAASADVRAGIATADAPSGPTKELKVGPASGPAAAGAGAGRGDRALPACRDGLPLQGETVDDPIWLTGNPPFWVEGNTCEYVDDYDEVCPYASSIAPDVVYAFQPVYDEVFHVRLCNSDYDTKVYIYMDEVTPGYPYECNDDACGYDGWKSELEYVSFLAGHTYYIVVDGYNAECGQYLLTLDYTWQCVFCSDGALWENEPDCHTDYVDLYDGGCDSDPPVFFQLDPSDEPYIELCGTTGAYLREGILRIDTDWYQITLTAPRSILWNAWCDYPLDIQLLDGREGCEGLQIIALDYGPYVCDYLQIEANLEPGTYWLWVGPDNGGVPCGTEYQSFLYGYTPDPSAAVEDESRTAPGLSLVVERQPVVGEAALRFSLPQSGPVTLEILDAAGRRVERLLDGAWLTAGPHALPWCAAGEDPRERTGFFFCRLRTAQGEVTRSLVRLR